MQKALVEGGGLVQWKIEVVAGSMASNCDLFAQ